MSLAQITAVRAWLAANPLIVPGASLADMRRAFDALGDAVPRLPQVTAQAVDAAGIAAEWLAPPAPADGRALLFLHGGGYALGSVRSHRALLERLAVASGIRVLAPNYRLAPEAPFPAAVEDACAVYRWLLAQGVAPGGLAIAGDSAGGGLALAALLALRDAGEPLPGCAVAISPWTDMEATGESMRTRADVDPIVRPDDLAGLAAMYLNDADPRTPLASPLHGDFRGLPPLLVQVGDAETLLDDTTRLAPLLRAAGVDATIEIWPDMLHVWHQFAPMLDEGQQAIARLGEFVREHTR